MRKTAPGFTIIEIIITLTVLFILASLAITMYNNFQKTSRDARRRSDLTVTRNSLEQYYADAKVYPPGVGVSLTSLTGLKPYFKNQSLPQDPLNDLSSIYDYVYKVCTQGINNQKKYVLCARMENCKQSLVCNRATAIPASGCNLVSDPPSSSNVLYCVTSVSN